MIMDKSAESPLLRAAINVMGTKALLDDQAEARQSLREAALEDLMARQQEARRMAPMRRGLRGAGGIAPDTTDYQGAGSFQDYDPGLSLALAFEKGGMAKEALNPIGALKAVGGRAMQAGGGISKGVGRLVGAAGQGLEQAGGALGRGLTPTSRFLRAGASEAQQFAGAVKPGVSGMLQGAGRKLQNAGMGIGVAGQNVAQGGRAMAQGALKPAVQQAGQAAAQAAGKPLLSAGTKAKALLGAGALGAGYVGYKGLQAARDYMSVPAGHHHQGYVQEGVNQYGYAQ